MFKIDDVFNWFITEGMGNTLQDLKDICEERTMYIKDGLISGYNLGECLRNVYGNEEEVDYIWSKILRDIRILD